MPRYRSFGGLDDSTVSDGDVGFLGVDARKPPWQLPPGMLTLSENGRIDGDWSPRKGADVVAEGSLSTGFPLRLPFWLIDEPGGEVVTVGERVDEVVTLTVPGHGLPVGETGATAVVNPTGSNNSIRYTAAEPGAAGLGISIEYVISGDTGFTITVVGQAIKVVMGQYAGAEIGGNPTEFGVPVVIPNLGDFSPNAFGPRWRDNNIIAYQLETDASALWKLRSLLTGEQWISTTASAYPDGLVYVPDSPNTGGTPTVTLRPAVAADVLYLMGIYSVVSSICFATADGPVTGFLAEAGPVYLQGGSVQSAYLGLEDVTGSPTVDPNGVWEMTPTDADTLTFSIPGASGSESYTVTSATVRSVIDDEATDEVFGSCLFSDPSSNNDESIFLAFGVDIKRVSLADGSITTYGLPGSETIDAPCDMIQAMDKVLVFRAGKVAFEWQVGDTDFSVVPSGAYTQPQVFTVTGTFVDVVSGLCTITGLTNNTVSTNDTAIIYDSTDPNFEPFKGEGYLVTAANATSFSFYIPVQDLSTISTNTLSIGRQVSIGGGFIHQPAFPWAVYFQRRLFGPYWYDVGSPFTDRDIRDELVASDILDTDTYDPVYNQFRITAGIADYIVALHPFYDDALLVLNRNSIHGVFGTKGSLADTSVRELTREIGCLARKSVVSQGGAVFFLSDSGVYVLQFFNDYNLRGVEKPLSENIEPYMDRISAALASEAVGIYFNNRYYLAVPLDSSPGAGDATGNNAILVYNMLNNEWESVDTFGDPAFLINNLIIGRAEKRNDLYAVTSAGGIHILEVRDNDYDILATNFVAGSDQFPIPAVMRTRAYTCGDLGRKRFIEMGCQIRSGTQQSDIAMAFSAEDPDSVGAGTLVSNTMDGPLPPEETADVRMRIGGTRGFNGQITLTREIGRLAVRSVKVQATITNRETITQK